MDAVIAESQPQPVEERPATRPRARRWARPLVWLTLALVVAQAPVAAAFAVLNRDAHDLWMLSDPFQIAGVVIFSGMGALLALRRPENAIGWLFLLTGLSTQTSILLGQWGLYGLVTAPGARGATLALWASLWFAAAALAYTPTLPLLLFPSGKLPGRRARVVAGLSLLSAASLLIALLTSNDHPPGFSALYEQTTNPLALDVRISDAGIAIILIALCGLASVGMLLARFRRSRGIERQQYTWVVLAMALTVVAFVADFVTRALGVPELYVVTGPLLSLAFLLIPITMALAILRYRLWEIDLIVSRTITWMLLSVCVVGSYVFIVGWLGTVFRTGGNLGFSLLATGVVAVVFHPLREAIQRRVTRLLYGERDEPYAAIARLGRRLEDSLAADAMMQAIAATVREALNLPYAAIAVAGEGGLTQHAGSGQPRGEPLRLPLVFQQEAVGELLVAPRAPGEAFSASDRALLDDLARQAGIAVHALRLSHELQQARERLVSAREEERRRLRRDLHDGLGSQLAALILQAGAVRPLVEADPAAARAELDELRAQLRAALGSIRTLVDGLRPPALDELGLLVALRERLRAFTGEGLVVVTALPDALPPLPAAVEVAIYRIVEEAVANVARHAQATRCVVRLVVEDAIALAIEDDGVGIAPGVRSGVGMQSMRERAEELGGSWQVSALAGGTRVDVRLPLGVEASGDG